MKTVDAFQEYLYPRSSQLYHYRLRIYTTDNQEVVVITELAEYLLPSINEVIEEIATEICRNYKLSPTTSIWIIHYELDDYRAITGYDQGFELLDLGWQEDVATAALWQRLSPRKVEQLTGDTWTDSSFTDEIDRLTQRVGIILIEPNEEELE